MKVTKTMRFDAAHVLTNHQGMCRNLHGHTYRVDVTVGKLLYDTYLPHVQAVDQQAEFTIDGGLNNAAVRVDGFKSFTRPKVLVKDETGLFVPLKLSYHDYDGIQSYLNADGSYGFSFIVNTTDGPSTIKVIQ